MTLISFIVASIFFVPLLFIYGIMSVNHKSLTCANCSSRESSLFSSFDCHKVEHLNEVKTCSFYKKKQPIFLQGSYPRGVYCLNSGKVKVFSVGSEGKEQIIHIAKEGEIIGLKALLSGDPYVVSAETLEDSNICFISKEEFLNMIEENSILRNRIMAELSSELNERTLLITNMAQKSVRERLAFSLILLQKIYGDSPINLSREDLANFVGTATETLIRLLKDFEKDGLIVTQVRKITIKDLQAIIRTANI